MRQREGVDGEAADKATTTAAAPAATVPALAGAGAADVEQLA